MNSISVQELKQALSEALRRVGLGEWITVLRHGRPVARIGPPDEPGLNVGPRVGAKSGLTSMGRRMTGGAYLRALADDREGDGR